MLSRIKMIWRRTERQTGKRYGLMHKAVAVFAAAFFISNTLFLSPSSAAVNEFVTSESGQLTPALSLAQINAQTSAAPAMVPSGVAIQNPNPLSLSASSLQGDGNSASAQPAAQVVSTAPLPLAANYYVNETDGIVGLQTAINNAQAGDTIHLSAGSFAGRVDLTFKAGVKIVGAGMDQTTIGIDGIQYSACGSGPSSTGPENCGGSITWADQMILSNLTLNHTRLNGYDDTILMSEGRIENVKFTGHYNVVTVTGSNNVFENVTFQNMSVALNGNANNFHKVFAATTSNLAGDRTGFNITGNDNVLDGLTVWVNPYARAVGLRINGDRTLIRNSIIYAHATTIASFSQLYAYGIHIAQGTGTKIEYSMIYTRGANTVYDVFMEGTADITFGNDVFIGLDPQFINSTPDPVLQPGYTLEPSSRAIDHGDLALTDPDASRLDIGFNFYDHRLPPPVPSGWIRVPSLPDLAYQRNGDVVLVMDLRTGAVSDKPTSQNTPNTPEIYCYGFQYAVTPEGLREIYWIRREGKTSIGIYDPAAKTWFTEYPVSGFNPNPVSISPDGKHFALIHNYNYLTVGALCGTPWKQSVKVQEQVGPNSPTVSFSSETQLLVNMHDVPGRSFTVTIQPDGTLAVIPGVPEGWTRATDNPNYAFQLKLISPPPLSPLPSVRELHLMNLMTGVDQVLIKCGDGTSGTEPCSSAYPYVAPSGKAVFFNVTSRGPAAGHDFLVIQSLEQLDKRMVITDRQIYYHIVYEGDIATFLLLDGSDHPPEVRFDLNTFTFEPPDGWTRAASNSNYALRMITKSDPQLPAMELNVFQVIDLRTGAMTDIISFDSSQWNVWKCDVSPDDVPRGAIAICELSKSASNGESEEEHGIVIRRISDPEQLSSFSVGFAEQGTALKSLEFLSSGFMLVKTSNVLKDGSQLEKTYRVNLQDFWVELLETKLISPPVPDGWARVKSNSNYAFRVAKQDTQWPTIQFTVLQVMDLRTEQVVTVENFGIGDSPVLNCDVSPDDVAGGPVVFLEISFAYSGSGSPLYEHAVIIRRLSDPGQYTFTSERVAQQGATLKSIEFVSSGIAVIKTANLFEDGTELENSYRVDLAALSSPEQSVKLVRPGKLFAVDVNSGYGLLILPEKESEHSNLYDLSGGTDQMKPVLWFKFPPFSADHISFAGISRLSPDNFMLSISFANADGSIAGSILTNDMSSRKCVVFEGFKIESLRLAGNIMVYQLKNAANEIKWTAVDLDTLQEVPLPVPAGWTRAATNQNFAFQERQINCQPGMVGCSSELALMDLRSGKETQLRVWNPSSSGDVVAKGPDVSADGQRVYYAFHGIRTLTDSVTVQSLKDLEKKTTLTGTLREISFLPSGDVSVVLRADYRNGTQIGEVYTVNKDTLASDVSSRKLLVQASAVLKAGYLVIPEHNDGDNSFTVTLYDASQGADHLVKIPHVFGYSGSGSSSGGCYTLVDVYKTAGGRTVISIAMSAKGTQDMDNGVTLLIDPKDGRTVQTLSLPGAVSAIRYEGSYAAYTYAVRPDTQWVDLDLFARLTVPPPAVTAMSKLMLLLGLYSDQRASIKLLQFEKKTWSDGCRGWKLPGTLCTMAEVEGYRVVLELYGNEYEFHAGGLDPAKQAAIAAISDMVTSGVALADIRINDVKIIAGQTSSDWYFEVILTTNGNKRIYNISPKYQILPLKVPEGWTRAASNVNFAFKEEYQRVGSYSQYTLKLQDLRTGQIQSIATRMAPYGGYTSGYVVSPDGSAVIYAKAGPMNPVPVPQTTYIQRISDPSRQLSLSGGLQSVSFEQNGQVAALILKKSDGTSQTVKVDLNSLKLLLPAIIQQARFMRDVQTSQGLRHIYSLNQNGQTSLIIYDPATTAYNQYLIPNFDPFTNNGSSSNLHALSIPVSRDYAIISMGDSNIIYGISLKDQREAVRTVQLAAKDRMTNLAWVEVGKARITAKSGQYYDLKIAVNGSLSLSLWIPSVPSGWIRTTGNSYFAYRVTSTSSKAGITQIMEIRDLVIGTVLKIRTAIYSGITKETLWGAPVVSADGKTVMVKIRNLATGKITTEVYSSQTGKRIS